MKENTNNSYHGVLEDNKKYKKNNNSHYSDRAYDEKYKQDKLFFRSDVSRDRDRILFSEAFRRLQHKVQVYSNEKGDYYQTRLTHT